MERGCLCYKFPIYKSCLSVLMETAIFIHSWLFQGWLLISYLPPTPAFPAGLGSTSALQTVFVKKIPLRRQVASKTRRMQDQDVHNWVYLSKSLTPHSLTTDLNVFFLAIVSPALRLFNYSMKTLGICSSSSYYQCHFLFGLCSIQVLFFNYNSVVAFQVLYVSHYTVASALWVFGLW